MRHAAERPALTGSGCRTGEAFIERSRRPALWMMTTSARPLSLDRVGTDSCPFSVFVNNEEKKGQRAARGRRGGRLDDVVARVNNGAEDPHLNWLSAGFLRHHGFAFHQ